MTTTILIVEDDADIAELVSIYLKKEGYHVLIAENAEQALHLFVHASPHMIICDIKLPDRPGTEVIDEVRKHSEVPVIFLSSKKETEDIINGFELGGDDYVTKPFDPDILVARVKAQLRRISKNNVDDQSAASVWRDDRLEINFHSWEVKIGGSPIALSTKEMQMLFLFARHPNQVFTVNHLYDHIWGLEGWSDSRTVMVHIHNLRKKIEVDLSQPRYIITVRGIGYKFVNS